MNCCSFIEPARSAVSATTFGFLRAASTIPSPKPLLVSLLPVDWISFNAIDFKYIVNVSIFSRCQLSGQTDNGQRLIQFSRFLSKNRLICFQLLFPFPGSQHHFVECIMRIPAETGFGEIIVGIDGHNVAGAAWSELIVELLAAHFFK